MARGWGSSCEMSCVCAAGAAEDDSADDALFSASKRGGGRVQKQTKHYYKYYACTKQSRVVQLAVSACRKIACVHSVQARFEDKLQRTDGMIQEILRIQEVESIARLL